MKVIVAGDGETGTHIARSLSVENQDIVLMGHNGAHLSELDAACNFITFEGSPLSRRNLLQCGADSADLFVAVTPDESVNLLACQIAKDCGTRRCVARVDSREFDSVADMIMLKRSGVDHTIHPEMLAAEEIRQFIDHNWVCDWIDIHNGALKVLGVRMRADGTLCGRQLKEIPNTPRLFHVAAIRRGDGIILPRGEDRLMEGDTIYFSVLPENYEVIPPLCGQRSSSIHRIMITGAGRVTENVIELLPRKYNITVIDPDRQRCNVIASRFPHVVAVNAQANDITALREEGMEKCDMFVALTGSSEKNILSCMVAREHGVSKTVSRIEELQYMPEAESLSIDKIINKKLLNTGKILSALLDSNVLAAQCMSLGFVEIADLVAGAGSAITSGPVASLGLSREFTVGGIIRDGRGMLVEGRTEIREGDHVVVFYTPGSLNKVNRYFR